MTQSKKLLGKGRASASQRIEGVILPLLISFFLFKTHDDFPYYHFPYTYHITQNATVFGLGELNHGFKTPSSIFFLNSLFYLPIIKYNLFQIGAALFFGFST